jgi:hypothetical protein
MNEPTPSQEDSRLRNFLCEWRVEAPLPSGFEDGVWRRISVANESVISGLLKHLMRRFDLWFARPALAISYVTLLVMAGLVAGSWQAQRESVRINQALARQYVQSVDPYQAPRH